MARDLLEWYDFRIIVCGDRKWRDERAMDLVLGKYLKRYPKNKLLIAQGEATGADIRAQQWAQFNRVDHFSFPAHWEISHAGAGPIRNAHQLLICPHLVIGFHDNLRVSKGTKDMLRKAIKAGVDIKHIAHTGRCDCKGRINYHEGL